MNVLAQVVVADSGCSHTFKGLGFLQSSQLSRLDACTVVVHCAQNTLYYGECAYEVGWIEDGLLGWVLLVGPSSIVLVLALTSTVIPGFASCWDP
jgi:hypothetical protein